MAIPPISSWLCGPSSFSSDEDDISTPPSSPERNVASSSFVTPEKLKKTIGLIKDEEIAYTSPLKDEKNIVREGLKQLNQLPTPDKKRKAGEIVDTTLSTLAPSDSSFDSPGFHNRAHKRLKAEGLSGTGRSVVSAARNILTTNTNSPRRIIPMSHLTTLEDTGGYHIHLPDSAIPITPLATNPITGISLVMVDGQKKSTLFPEGTTEADVIAIVDNAETIAKEHNRSLRKTDRGYVIECYVTGPIQFSSLFPVFSFADFEPDQKYVLTENFAIYSRDVLKAAIEAKEDQIRYKTYDGDTLDTVVIDLAPAYQDETNVDKGILFKFDKEQAGELFDFYKTDRPDIFYKDELDEF